MEVKTYQEPSPSSWTMPSLTGAMASMDFENAWTNTAIFSMQVGSGSLCACGACESPTKRRKALHRKGPAVQYEPKKSDRSINGPRGEIWIHDENENGSWSAAPLLVPKPMEWGTEKTNDNLDKNNDRDSI